MPEHIRALIVIVFLSLVVFAIAKRPACQLVSASDFSRRRNLWFGLTSIAFLAHNFWIYVFASSAVLMLTAKTERRPVALYLTILFVLPAAFVQVPGFGLVNYLVSLSHQRLLTIVVLIPVFLALVGRRDIAPFGRFLPDKLIAAYMILIVLLYIRETSLTDVLRQAFYQFIDVFIPYFVISRSLRNKDDFRHALLAFTLAAMVMALIAAFEAIRYWLLYKGLIGALDLDEGMTGYLGRAGFLRAIATAGHPIALGYVMAIALGFYLYLQRLVPQDRYRKLGLILVMTGLLAALSRGPWLGALLIVAVYIATGNYAFRRLTQLLLASVVALSIVSVLPGGERVMNLIPFMGETENQNISYRQRLLDNSIIVIKRNPWLGSVNYMQTPEMEAMRQGRGIIDIVNTYVRVGLESGLIGLSIFTGFFLVVCWQLFKAIRRMSDKNSEDCILGRSLLATILGIMLMIFTVSSITIIPIVYWSVAAICVAYIQMIKQEEHESRQLAET